MGEAAARLQARYKGGKQHLDGFESISKTHAETRRSALKERAQLLRHFVPGFVISLFMSTVRECAMPSQ